MVEFVAWNVLPPRSLRGTLPPMPVATTVHPGYAVSAVTGAFRASDIDQALLDFTRSGTAPAWVFDLSKTGTEPPGADVEGALVAALQVAAKRGLRVVVVVTTDALVRLAAQVVCLKARVVFRCAKALDEAVGLAG